MALELVEVNRALNKVEDPSQLLSPHTKSAIHDLVATDVLPKLVSNPSVVDAASLPAVMDNLGGHWKFAKVVSFYAAAKQTTTEQAHKRVGSILLNHGTFGQHYYGGTLTPCRYTGNITVHGDVKVTGIGLNLILGFDRDLFGLAYTEYIYKCVVALAKEVKDAHTYMAKEDQVRNDSTAAFNERKGKMVALGRCGSPPVAQALGMRNDKAAYTAILGLDPGVSATHAMREAGITGKKTVAKSLNHDGTRRLLFLRSEIGMNIEDNPHASPDAVARFVVVDMGEAFRMKDMQTRRPIGYKKQTKRMSSKKLSKRSLQQQNLLL